MMSNFISNLNQELFFALHGLAGISPDIDTLISFFAQHAEVYVVAFGMVFILFHQHKRNVQSERTQTMELLKELMIITLAIAASLAVALVLKYFFSGLRPFEFFTDLEPLFLYGGGDSFPSGHATLFSALAMMLVMLHRSAGVGFVIVAILISISRIIAGIHYPIDVLAGWIIGGGISYLVYLLLAQRRWFSL